jgi:hypothetical protein
MVAAVCNIHETACSNGNTARLVKKGTQASPFGETRRAACKRAHHTAGRQLTDAMLKKASDKNTVVCIGCSAMRVVKKSARAGTVKRACRSIPSYRAHDTSERYVAYAVVGLVRND